MLRRVPERLHAGLVQPRQRHPRARRVERRAGVVGVFANRRELRGGGSRFTLGLFRMFLARAAYLSVFSVSSRFVSVGLTHAIMHVLEFPPRES